MNRITIFHYHLLPGGVTNVILLGVKALVRYSPKIRHIRLVCGKIDNTDKILAEIKREIDASENKPEVEISVMPEISYVDFSNPISDDDIEALSTELLSRYGESFWWIHNYQLGKNPLFTAAIVHIAETRIRQKLLLHIHDFPECARFDNLDKLYSAGITNPYPNTVNSAYALINGRDTELLKSAGIPENRIFLLNNPVERSDAAEAVIGSKQSEALKTGLYKFYKDDFPGINPEAKLLFYPVRTIRRKNILETGLIAAISEEPVNLAVSLPGVSEQEKKYSDTCEKCFRDGIIPGIWGSGVESDPAVPTYPRMLEICDMIISSSVQEGFGYLFINAVQSGTPLFARDLDILNGIRRIFPGNGSFFYDAVYTPISRTETETLIAKYRNKLKSLKEYLSPTGLEKLSNSIERLVSNGKADYSYLPVEMQVSILNRVKESDNYRKEILSLNREPMNVLYRMLDEGRYSADSDLEIFALKAHYEKVTEIMKCLYRESIEEPAVPGTESVQHKMLDNFAELKYMRLLYDY